MAVGNATAGGSLGRDKPRLASLKADQQFARSSLSAQVYDHIKRSMMLGQLEPGTRITFRNAAEQLGMSVTPTREALLQLVAERILIVEQGRSMVVPPLTADGCVELWKIRTVLEGYCAALAAARVTGEIIDELDRINRGMLAAKGRRDVDAALLHNMEFHFTLYRCVEMPSLLWMIENLWAKAGPYVAYFLRHHVTKRTETAAQGPHIHSTVIQALRAGDAGTVKERLERDILDNGQGIVSLLLHDGTR